MSTGMGDDPTGSRRIDRDDLAAADAAGYPDEMGPADDLRASEPVEGRVIRREVITPSATDPVTVLGADADRRAGPCWNRIVGGTLGVVYLAIGIAGFFLDQPAGAEFAGREGSDLFGLFQVNNLHNVVHIVIGAVLLLGALAGHAAARSANLLVALAYLAVGLIGIFAEDSDLNVLALNGADHVLHLGTAALLGLTALVDRAPHEDVGGRRRARTA